MRLEVRSKGSWGLVAVFADSIGEYTSDEGPLEINQLVGVPVIFFISLT